MTAGRLGGVNFDPDAALRLGGWDPRYAVVRATAARGGVAAALVDTNGDGADVDLDQYEQAEDGRWVGVASGNCDDAGALATGFMALAWGRATPRAVVTVELEAASYTVGLIRRPLLPLSGIAGWDDCVMRFSGSNRQFS